MKCYLLIGLPGSGKSFLTNKVQKENPFAVVLSMDNIIDNYAKEHNMSYREVWADYIKIAEKKFEDTLSYAIENKQDIIWDQTNLHELSRSSKIDKLLNNSYQVDGLALELSEVEWLKRITQREAQGGKTMPREVLNDMAKSYQSPQYSEGFHNIFIINDKNEFDLKVKDSFTHNRILSVRDKVNTQYNQNTQNSDFKYNK